VTFLGIFFGDLYGFIWIYMDLYVFIWIYGKFMAFSEALHRFHDPPRLLPVAPEVRLSLQRAMFHAGGTPPSPRSHGNAGKVAQKHTKNGDIWDMFTMFHLQNMVISWENMFYNA
jgi:hypothetical protein